MSETNYFIEVDHFQERKHNQMVCGDVFLSQKTEGGDRVISVLADGLGSGIKASVLATLTTSMLARYVTEDMDITHAAKTIMETLPVCSERKIAYSTFTIVDMDRRGETRIVEFDNPPYALLRDGIQIPVDIETLTVNLTSGREASLRCSSFVAQPGDRIAIFSDGVSQAGVGQRTTPLGWGADAASRYLCDTILDRPAISARHLARTLAQRALSMDGFRAKDDITCGVIYLRNPREVIVFTGPPVDRRRDVEMAAMAATFKGRKIICGGTTTGIMSRELNRSVFMDLKDLDPEIPPTSVMEGFDLVTEGAITLAKLVRLLEEEENPELLKPNAVTQLAGLLLDSDIIHIVAGTKINEALQDPNLPQELDIRRNILRRLRRVLTNRFLKDVQIRYI
ncbi:MAG TPA: SpoIIE family protein phosphatase [Holophaga sp.]|jgi:Stage II sporulation protein E (SpoIIE)|nr:SpoIIE family protein phosphatase [Holophaga sp.]